MEVGEHFTNFGGHAVQVPSEIHTLTAYNTGTSNSCDQDLLWYEWPIVYEIVFELLRAYVDGDWVNSKYSSLSFMHCGNTLDISTTDTVIVENGYREGKRVNSDI